MRTKAWSKAELVGGWNVQREQSLVEVTWDTNNGAQAVELEKGEEGLDDWDGEARIRAARHAGVLLFPVFKGQI